MPRRHSLVRLNLAITGIRKDVGRADRARAPECGIKDLRVAGHRKLIEGFSRRAGKCVEAISFATLSDYIVKECTELRSAELNAGIGDDLDQALQIELSANRDAGLIQNFKRARFLPQLSDPGFESLIYRQQPCFQLLPFIDVVIAPTQNLGARVRPRIDLTLACEPVQSAIWLFDPEFNIKASTVLSGFQGIFDLQCIVRKNS